MAQAINWRGCIQKVKETVKADLPDEEILSVLRKAKASVDRKKRIEGTVNNAEFIQDFANEAVDEATRAAQALKIQRLRQIVLYRERSTHIKLARQAGMNEFEATSSLSVTSHKSFIGAADSVETRQKAKSYEYGKIYDDYERLGLGRFVRESTPEFRRDYAIERSILSGVKREGTGNQQAKDLALLNFKYQEKARRDLNDLGADIGKLDDFIARQTHNRIKLKKYSYIEWRDDVMKWVSDDTFDWIDEGLTNGQRLDLVDEWLGGFHDNVLTGLHDDVNALEWGVVKDLEEFTGHANLAKKLSQSRKLHFKDAESWLAYNEKYGNGNVFETTLQGLESNAKAYGLMSVWGTNPQAAFDNHLKQIASDLKKESALPKQKLPRTFEENIDFWVTNKDTLKQGIDKIKSLLPKNSVVDEAALKGIRERLELRDIERSVGDFDLYRSLKDSHYPRFPKDEFKVTDKNHTYVGEWAGQTLQVTMHVNAVEPNNLNSPGQVFQNFLEIVNKYEANKIEKSSDGFKAQYKISLKNDEGIIFDFEKSNAGANLKVRPLINKIDGAKFSQIRNYEIPDKMITDQEVQTAFNNYLAEAKKQYIAPPPEKPLEANPNTTDKLDKFLAQQQKLRNQFDQVTGKANIARDPTLAAIGSVYRTITMLARLGGVLFSSVTDVPIKASVMRHNGTHVLQGNLDGLVSYVRGLGSEEQQRFISQFMVANEGMIAFYNSKLTEKGSVRGWAARAHYFFGKYSLLNYVTNAQRSGMGMALTHNMANMANKEFNQLDKLLQGNLIRYNIDNLAWDVLRKTKAEVIQGKSFIGTDGVRNLDLQEFTELARRNHANFDNVKPERQQKLLIEARDQLERRYRQYVVDQVDEAITRVGSREKAFMYGESKPGTVWGEVVRLFWQLKSFGLTYVSKHLRREFGRYGKADIPGIVQLMVGTTLFGIVGNSLSDVSAGRVPRSLNDPRTWLAAFIRGGGAGIYGDFLFGEYSRYGSSPLAVLSGPGIGNIESALRIMGNLRDGETGKAGIEMFRLFKSHVPFQNLFYTKQVTDYLFFNQLLEVINPGYLKKMEKRLETTYGQSYFIPPSSLVKEGGGFK